MLHDEPLSCLLLACRQPAPSERDVEQQAEQETLDAEPRHNDDRIDEEAAHPETPSAAQPAGVFAALRARLRPLSDRWLRLGLPGKLLLLTISFVMLAEVLIFIPSVANFRLTWLQDRLTAAELASLAAQAVPGGAVPDTLRADLLRTAKVEAVALKKGNRRVLILPPERPLSIDAFFDLRPHPEDGFWRGFLRRVTMNRDALGVFFIGAERTLRVIGAHGSSADDFIEIVLPEGPLHEAMIGYGLNVLTLSIFISLITAALVYLALSALLVRPMMRITRSMVSFSQNPEDVSRIITPSARHDEVGTAERELAQMQYELNQALKQKNRLAQLGLAVSKINHDLRNMLANAQLISDRLTAIPDPTVQRFAPKLIASLDRAISFCNSSLTYGKAEEAAPRRELKRLRPLVDEVADGLGLPRDGEIGWIVDMDKALRVDADPEHLFRVLSNIVRNAVQALEQYGAEKPAPPGKAGGTRLGDIRIKAWRDRRRVVIEIRDTGPGLPPKARENIFRAFQGSVRKGGTGLGLAIASELIQAHGGRLELLDAKKGAAFRIEIPDRAVK